MERRFPITASELVSLHHVLSSEVCIRIFELLRKKGRVGVTAASRLAGSNTTRATVHLRTLTRLGVTREERFDGQHTFHLNPESEVVDLLEATINLNRPKDVEP